jgi:hypothetical protein
VAMNLYLASSKKELSLDEFANQLNPDSNDDFKFIQFLYLTSHYLVPKGHFIADSVINYILAWNPSKKIKNLLHIADSDID